MTGTAVKGTLGIGFEPASNPGKQPLLTPTAAATTMSLTTQPTITTVGVHLYVLILGVVAGAAPTVAIAGLKPDGVTAVSETIAPNPQLSNSPNGIFEYTTKATFGSVNASGITITSVSGSLAQATVQIFGIMGAKFLVPAVATFDEDFDEASPQDHRGILDEDIRMLQLNKHVKFDIKSALYPESDQFLGPTCIGNVTNPATPASVPASPVVLKASATFTVLGSPFTLTTPPTSPGMLLLFVIAGNALAGTLTITGTAPLTGQTIAEVVNVTAGTPNGTFYAQNVYATVTNIAVTGFTAAATCATSGVFVFTPTYLPTDALISPSFEWYSGTESSVFPYGVPQDWELDYDQTKEMSLMLKGEAQSKLTIGDRTRALLTTSDFAVPVQPTDFPIPGWGGLFYLDPLSGTAGTTQWLDILTFKIKGKTGLVPYWTATGSQDFNRVGRKKRKVEVDIEIDFTNVVLYDDYKRFLKKLVVAKFQSIQAYLGTSGSVNLYKTMQFTLTPRFVKFILDPKDEKVIGKLTATCEYEPSLGYSHRLDLINQNTPNYAA